MKIFSLASFLCLISFPITIAQAVLVVENDFDSGTSWSFIPDPTAGSFSAITDVWEIVSSVGTGGTAITMSNNFWGARDVDNDDNLRATDDGLLTFSDVDLSGFNSAVLTFDYSAFGYDGGDDIFYTLFFDNVAQAQANPVVGLNGVGGVTTAGTITEIIPDSVSTVSLVVVIDQNGNGDWAGVDNFAINATAIPEPSAFLFGGLICAALGLNYTRRKRTSTEA